MEMNVARAALLAVTLFTGLTHRTRRKRLPRLRSCWKENNGHLRRVSVVGVDAKPQRRLQTKFRRNWMPTTNCLQK